jgi:hypothetical protein
MLSVDQSDRCDRRDLRKSHGDPGLFNNTKHKKSLRECRILNDPRYKRLSNLRKDLCNVNSEMKTVCHQLSNYISIY